MILFQFQFSNIENDKEYELIPHFCRWLCEQIYARIDTTINRKKIQLRLKYLYTVPWIKWIKHKYTDTETIMNTIHKCLFYKQYRGNVWKIQTDTNIVLPNTITSFDRIIRFINYGDAKISATGILTIIQQYYTFSELQSLWQLYCMQELGYMTDTRIIGEAKKSK